MMRYFLPSTHMWRKRYGEILLPWIYSFIFTKNILCSVIWALPARYVICYTNTTSLCSFGLAERFVLGICRLVKGCRWLAECMSSVTTVPFACRCTPLLKNITRVSNSKSAVRIAVTILAFHCFCSRWKPPACSFTFLFAIRDPTRFIFCDVAHAQ